MSRSRLVLPAVVALLVAALAVPAAVATPAQYDGALRLDGSTPRVVAIQTSRALWTAGSAGAVVLAREDTFPDALGAAALAASVDGPILLTPPDRLVRNTRDEIARVLPEGGKVYLLGGTAALSPQVEQDLEADGFVTPRFPGRDRIDTAAMIARFTGASDRGEVLLARAFGDPDLEQGWVDSVSCGGWAAESGSPILLTRTGDDQVAAETLATIDRLGASTVHVCGGAAAVPDAQLEQLQAAGLTVERHAGPDRATTAVAVATDLWGAGRRDGRTFLLVPGYGTRFGYGLVVAPLSARLDAPILLVDTDTPTSCDDPRVGATLCLLGRGDAGANAVVAVGGTGVISDDVLIAAAEAADLPKDDVPPAVPANLTAVDVPEDDGTGLEVSWDAVGEEGVTYTLYIRVADGDRLTRRNSFPIETDQNAFAFDNLEPDTPYDLAVDSQDGFGNRSSLSATVTVTLVDEVPASPPPDVGPTVASEGGALVVSWLPAPEADVATYRVQRLDASALLADPNCDPSDDLNPATWENVATVSAPKTSFSDTTGESGTPYCYRYFVSDTTGNEAPNPSGPGGPAVAP